jgi:hypothetical protein
MAIAAERCCGPTIRTGVGEASLEPHPWVEVAVPAATVETVAAEAEVVAGTLAAGSARSRSGTAAT